MKDQHLIFKCLFEKHEELKKEFELFKKNTAFREGLSIENRERLKKELEEKEIEIDELKSTLKTLVSQLTYIIEKLRQQ